MGCWIEEGPNPNLRTDKLVYSPIDFLFCFRDSFGVKTSFSRIGKFNFTFRAWIRRREEGKGERSMIRQERQGIASEIRGG